MEHTPDRPALLNNRPFMFLTSAQAISDIGNWLNIVALFILVGLKLHGNPLDVSLIVLCMAVPMTFLGPVTGMVADRVERKTLMILSNIMSGTIVLVLTQVNSLWQVYIVILALAFTESFFSPAENGKLKEIVDDEHMKQAVSVRSVVKNGAKIIGPSISGALVAVLGLEAVFYINAVTFFVAALLLLGIPQRNSNDLKPKDEPHAKAIGWLKELNIGISHMRNIRWLLAGTLLFTTIMFVLQLVDSQFVTLLRLLPHVPVHVLGFAMSASGVGMIVSSIISSRIKWTSLIPVMSLGSLGVGLAFGGIALAISFHAPDTAWLFLPCGFLAGGSFGFVIIPFQSSAQEATPVHLTGRVFGVISSLSNVAALSGPLVGGILASLVGIVPTALLSGSLLVLVGVIMLFLKKFIEPRGTHVAKSNSRIQGAPPQ